MFDKGTARAGQNRHVDLFVGEHLIQHLVQIGNNLCVQGVQGLLPVNGYNANVPLFLQFYKTHVSFLLSYFSALAARMASMSMGVTL